MMLIKIEPPLPFYLLNTQNDVSEVIIATRFEGDTLFPISNLPLSVYVCDFASERITEDGFINSDNLRIIDWGEIFQQGYRLIDGGTKMAR